MQVQSYTTPAGAVNLPVQAPSVPGRPVALTVRRDGIPVELAELRQWVMWRFEWQEPKNDKPGRWTKVPYAPRSTTRKASSTSPSDWGTLADAFHALSARPGYFDGIGFVFTKDDPYIGIDLDKVRDAGTGDIEDDEARAIIRRMGSWTELSPSGAGVHIIARGDGLDPAYKNRAGIVEIYDSGRFFTVTGQTIDNGFTDIADRGDAALELQRSLGRKAEKRTPGAPVPITPVNLEDAHILELAQRARNGEKVRALYAGDTSGHGEDHSAADMALIRHLAFYTQDAAQLERLWRSSGLWREKAEIRPDYVQRTIDGALSGLTDVYEPAPTVARLLITSAPSPAPIDASEIEYLRIENARLRAERDALYRAVLNPELNSAELKAATSVLLLSRGKEPNHNGTVDLSDREIAGDWRPRKQAFNGDGTRPIMNARYAKQALEKLSQAGVVDAEKRPDTVRRKGKLPIHRTVWELERVVDPVEYWTRIADYTTDTTDAPKMRKQREANRPCPACGEVHAVRKITTCEGCGVVRKITIQDPDRLTDDDRERLASEDPHGEIATSQEPVQAAIEPTPGKEPEPVPAPKPSRTASPLDTIAARILIPRDDTDPGVHEANDMRVCCDCGELTANRYRCDTCIQAAQREGR